MDETQQTGQQKPGKKKPRGKAFAGKDDPRRYGSPTYVPAPEAEAADPGDMYLSMRRVLGGVSPVKDTPLDKACREWLKKNPVQFMSRYAELEAAAVTGGGTGAQDRPAKDGAQERVETVIRRLLEEWGVQNARPAGE